MSILVPREEDRHMTTADRIDGRASELLEAAQRFQSAEPAQSISRAMSAGLSRELEVQLVGTLHDVAAGFARCARMCRDGRSVATPTIAWGTATGHASGGGGGVAPPDSQEATERVA
jgi:hypothetical protein